MPDINDCVTEVGQHILNMLSSRDTQRRVSDRYRDSLTMLDPQAVLLQLTTGQAAFPQLKAQTVQANGETLYKLKTGPATKPQYFVVRGTDVQRVQPPA